MAWTTTLTETQNDGRQTLTFSISGNNTDDAANTKKVSFETLQGSGYYRTFTSVTYNEFDDITELLTQNLTDSASAANMTPEDEYDVVLDFSALTDDRLWIDLRFLSSHQRPDQSRVLRDGVDANSVGSTITHIIGTDNDDHIIGSYQAETIEAGDGDDYIAGGGGDDILEGMGGTLDNLKGGEGNDTASYASVSHGVTASLADATHNQGDAAGDIYASIENLLGSAHNDRLTGDGESNILDGNGGSDRLTGGTGDDVFILDLSDSGDDTVTDFGTGSNVIRIAGDGSQTSLSDFDIEVSDDGTDTTLYYDSDDDGTAETLVMTLQNFTGWDESSHLDIV